MLLKRLQIVLMNKIIYISEMGNVFYCYSVHSRNALILEVSSFFVIFQGLFQGSEN